ncbi:unnamed protein product [Meganyctiphanes norvegica]|uniref:CCHC-type domain-containing protein n=1 Tax=Meganyctiphanes norvegica TaxID=48144 RepID=A0AAV2PFX5_MEGNR
MATGTDIGVEITSQRAQGRHQFKITHHHTQGGARNADVATYPVTHGGDLARPHPNLDDQMLLPSTPSNRRQHPTSDNTTDEYMEDWTTVRPKKFRKKRTQGQGYGGAGTAAVPVTTVTPIEPGDIHIKCIGISKTEDLINDPIRIRRLLNNTIFRDKYVGKGKLLKAKHTLILRIKDKRDIPVLLCVPELKGTNKTWPIECYSPETSLETNFGVIKLHPSISDDSIQEEIVWNSEFNSSRGAKITEIFRIKKKYGRDLVPTYSVRVKFEGTNRPTHLYHGDEHLLVHPYYPRLIICARCSKSGHVYKYCTSAPRCGRCGKNHEKNQCRIPANDQTRRKCPNCQEQHTAAYGGCQYIKIEKQILREHAEHKTPKSDVAKYYGQM